MSSGVYNFTRGLDRAVLTAVVTVSLLELLKYIRSRRGKHGSISHEANTDINGVTAAPTVPPGEDIQRGGSSAGALPVRGQRWYTYQTWNIPSLDRDEESSRPEGIDNATVDILRSYEVDAKKGFLPARDPLKRLTQTEYLIWEDVADELPKFLGVRFPQVREVLLNIPKLSTENLTTRAELERAHFLLALFAHSFVWGGFPILDYIPENIAVPLCEVSRRLEVPPLLCYFDIVLNNWRRLDDAAVISMGNLATLNNFFDGRDESWFYLITVEIEYLGARAVAPLYQLTRDLTRISKDDIDLSDLQFIKLVDNTTLVLLKIAEVIASMTESMSHMREGCDPYIFFHRVRPFLAGWKRNPAVPNGVRYLGVKNVFGGEQDTLSSLKSKVIPGVEQFPYQQFSGGSAAQSTLLPFFDILLGVDHSEHDASPASNSFLRSMRAFMPRGHRAFLEHIEDCASLRPFILACHEANIKAKDTRSATLFSYAGSEGTETNSVDKLLSQYDECLKNMAAFRGSHMKLVAEYIIAQQKNGTPSKNTIGATAGGKGTGGTDLMKFLRPIRENISSSVIISSPSYSKEEDHVAHENESVR